MRLRESAVFECRHCGNCCRQAGFVYLEEGEAETLADFLEIEVYGFTEKFCDLQDRRRLILKKHPGEVCIFLAEQNCSVYSIRPKQCRDFPLRWRTERSNGYCRAVREGKACTI